MAAIIVHNYTPTSMSINGSTIATDCEIVVIGTCTQINTEGVVWHETISARDIEEISLKLQDVAFEFFDKFALVRKYFKGICGWCDNRYSGLIYSLLYYKNKLQDIARTRSTAKAWKKQAGRYFSGLG